MAKSMSKDRRKLAELEREREEKPFLLLKGYIPQLLYDAVVLLFELARALLFQRNRRDAREVAEDIASAFLVEQWDNKLEDLRDRTDSEVRSYCFNRSLHDVEDHMDNPRTRDHVELPDDDRTQHGLSVTMPVERKFERQSMAADIERAIRRRLSPREAEVIRLRWRREMEFEEIARELGMSPATARVHAMKAYIKMRPALEHYRTAYGRTAHE